MIYISDGEIIKEFELESIAIGIKKTLDVRNVKIPTNKGKISFLIIVLQKQDND